MTARDLESFMLAQCAKVAQGKAHVAQNQREANVFRVASMVMSPRMPTEAVLLRHTSEDYFSTHPGEQLPAAEVVRRGWVVSMPRLRDMLSLTLSSP